MRDVRSVWDLTLEEIEELHSRRHMNNYVHAGLLVPLLSVWPQELRRVRPGLYPPSVEQAVNGVLAAVPDLIRRHDTSGTRIRVTRSLFELYRSLPELHPDQMSELMRLFAGLAFVVLKAERDDNMPLWMLSPIRKPFLQHERTFTLLLQPFALEELLPIWQEEVDRNKIKAENWAMIVFPLVMRSVQAILVMAENGLEHETVAKALVNLEQAMLDCERRRNLAGQIRYRNTLYLYGGNMFQRMGRFEQARAWYLKDIDDPNLPSRFHGSGYLVPLKTCERLISAHEITDSAERSELLLLIHAMLSNTLAMVRSFAQGILSEIDRHPEANLRPAWVKLGDRQWLFGGEGCRELLLVALLYQKMVRAIPYADTDYSLFEPAPGPEGTTEV